MAFLPCLIIAATSRECESTRARLVRRLRASGDSPEAGVAHRISGIYLTGMWEILSSARRTFERALAISDPKRDRDLAFRFGHDPRISASVQLGVVLWVLGEVVRAAQLFQDVGASIPDVSHLGTTAQCEIFMATCWKLCVEICSRGGALSGRSPASHTNTIWRCGRRWHFSLRVGRHGTRAMRNARPSANARRHRRSLNAEISLGLQRTDQGRACSGGSGKRRSRWKPYHARKRTCVLRTIGQRWFDAEIHRVRGEILLKKHADSPAPAEDAYRAAIAIAKAEGARSFESAGVALARQALPIDRPPRRSARRPRARARRLCADAGNARDR